MNNTRRRGPGLLLWPLLIGLTACGTGTISPTTTTTGPTTTTSATDSATTTTVAIGPGPQGWIEQFGTIEMDMGGAVAVDPQGFIVVVGSTRGDLAEPNEGDLDVFVRKYTPDGVEEWTSQFGTTAEDQALAVATDEDGNIFVVGSTRGDLAGPNQGNHDVFVRKYTPDGDAVWTEQFGSDQFDIASGVTVAGDGNPIIAGRGIGATTTQPAGFVRKYNQDPDGEGVTEAWTHITDAAVSGVAVDVAGNIIAVGTQRVEGFATEVFALKLDSDGDEVWHQLYGTGTQDPTYYTVDWRVSDPDNHRDPVPETRRPVDLWENVPGYEDSGDAVAVDATGNIFVTGYMGAWDTSTGNNDERAYLLKLAPDGEEVWAILFDDAHKTHGNAVTVDASGDVIVTGNTASYYDVRSPAGTEMFVRKLTSDGVQLWEDWFGDSGWDISSGVATDADGNIFNTGYTLGELGDASFGERDVYLRKYLP